VIDEIRRAKREDYDEIVEINNATWPQYKTTKDELLEDDHARKLRYHSAKFVALRNGKVLGVGQYDQLHADFDPHTFWIEINVDPSHQREGIGTELYNRLVEELQPLRPFHIRALTRDDTARGARFFIDRGFTEAWTAYDATLDLKTIDESKVRAVLATAAARGIHIYSLSSLSKDKNRDLKAYALHTGTRRSAPMAAPAAELSFETYVRTVLRSAINPDSYFVAVKDDQYIGLTILEKRHGDSNLRLVWLGTEESNRRNGVATALMAHAALYAKSKAYPDLHTSLTSLNQPLLAATEKFGFVRPFGIIHLQLDIAPPQDEPDKDVLEISLLEDNETSDESDKAVAKNPA
jgi:GNAT superfamily N-acetyltransferase